MDKRMVIIDGNSLINRAFYGIPTLTTKEGLHTNAVYGFVNMLYKILEEYDPRYISVAFDRKAPTFRHMEFEDYKAGRKRMPDELSQQMPILKEVLDAFRIHRVEIDGFEADDLIGTLVKYGENASLHPIVVTGDRDALQLASEITKILITKKGISSLEVYDKSEVLAKYEVTPEQFIDLKGLMGDKSDNIPGVPGIGEKTAIKLIKEFDSIENLLKNTDRISNAKLKQKIEDYAEQAMLSKRLATIMTDVPVEISLEEMQTEKPDMDKLIPLFRKLEFHSLINKLKKDHEQPDYIQEQQDITVLKETEDIQVLSKKLKQCQTFIFKIFWDAHDIFKDPIVGICIMLEDEYIYIDLRENPQNISLLKDVFEDEHIKKYGHETKKDVVALLRHGIHLRGLAFDAAIALYLIEPTRSNYDIHNIAAEYLAMTFPSSEDVLGKGKNAQRYQDIEAIQLAQHGFHWCTTVKGVNNVFMKSIEENGLEKLFFHVEMPLIEVLADMEYRGVCVNKEKLQEIGEKLDEKIHVLTSEIYQLAGESFNINSTKQLGEILFDKLGLPTIKKTKTGYSTNAEVLEKLYKKHEIIPKIIEYRQLVKLKSTYIDGLIAVINPTTNKIHSSFNQTVTSTGRISSTEPNLQNIPIKLEAGREIRKVFVPSNHEYLFLDADYSQIELRVLAHISQDENLKEAFHLNQDIHATTAAKVFNVPLDEVTSFQRSSAKAVNFGIVYGISDYGLSENLHIARKEAQRYIDEYFKKYHGVKAYMEKTVKECVEKGYVTTMLNRRRYIPEIKSSNYNLKSFGERTAMNTPIQGSAADIIKIAMIKVYTKLKERQLKSKLILQVHDELLVEVYRDEIEEVKKIVENEMENALSMDVPLKIDLNIGESWYDTK
ncbi:MAG: DNA polymerase I [Bacillota bacterium]